MHLVTIFIFCLDTKKRSKKKTKTAPASLEKLTLEQLNRPNSMVPYKYPKAVFTIEAAPFQQIKKLSVYLTPRALIYNEKLIRYVNIGANPCNSISL